MYYYFPQSIKDQIDAVFSSSQNYIYKSQQLNLDKAYCIVNIIRMQWSKFYSRLSSEMMEAGTSFTYAPIDVHYFARLAHTEPKKVTKLLNTLLANGIILREMHQYTDKTTGEVLNLPTGGRQGFGAFRYALPTYKGPYTKPKMGKVTTAAYKAYLNDKNAFIKDVAFYDRQIKNKLSLNMPDVDHLMGVMQDINTKPNIIEKYQWHINAFNNNLINTIRPDKASRVYSSISNMPSLLRENLLIDGRFACSVDLKNSQILFSIPVIEKYLQATKAYKKVGYPADWLKFKALTLTGEIYDYIISRMADKAYMKALGKTHKVYTDRKAFKQEFFKDFWYGRVSNPKSKIKPLKAVLMQEFPSIIPIIEQTIKGGYKPAVNDYDPNRVGRKFRTNKAKSPKDFAAFPIALQRMEAKVIFDNVNMKLLRAGIPCFNVFDSLIFLPEHKDLVLKTLEDAFTFLKDVKPPTEIDVSCGVRCKLFTDPEFITHKLASRIMDDAETMDLLNNYN